MIWIQTIIVILIIALIVVSVIARLKRRKGESRMYKDTAAWLDRESSKERPSGFAHAGFGNDETPSP